MSSRIRTYDRTGTLIYELSAPAFREWVLNDVGNASFEIKAAGMEPYIENGNYITIEHDKLETYVGIITTPRNWSSGEITINCKSAMQLFAYRRGAYEQAVSGSWGSIFSTVLGYVNAPEATLIKIGDYDDGISYSSVVDMSNIYTYLQRALAQAQTRLDFRPVIENGKLAIYADMKPTLYTASPLFLREGLNVKNKTSILIEQGEIYNDITILGIGLDQTKYTANAQDAASISRFGLRQFLFSEGTSQSDVNRLATVRLAQYAWPRKTLSLSAGDKGDTFLYTRVGNSGTIELNSVGYLNGGIGFRGTVNIRVIQYDDSNAEAVLVTEEL